MEHKFRFRAWIETTSPVVHIRHIDAWILYTNNTQTHAEYMNVKRKIIEYTRKLDFCLVLRLPRDHNYFISGTGTATISDNTTIMMDYHSCTVIELHDEAEKVHNPKFVVESSKFENIKNADDDDEEFQPKFVVESVQFEDIENTDDDEEFQDRFAQAFQKAHDEDIDDEETCEETEDRIKQYAQDIRNAYAKDTAQLTALQNKQLTIQQIKELISQEITNNNYQIKELVTREITNQKTQNTRTISTTFTIAIIAAAIYTTLIEPMFKLTLLYLKK